MFKESKLPLPHLRFGRHSAGLAAILFFTGCAHVTNYYEENIEGKQPFTTMGCFGPTSRAFLDSISGISIMVNEYGTPADGIKIRIEVYSETGGRFSFTSNFVTLSSAEFSDPIKVQMEDFTVDYHAGAVTGPMAELVIKQNSRFDTNIKLPIKAKEFYLQLPEALINGNLASFPRFHFKGTIKAYIGLCEA